MARYNEEDEEMKPVIDWDWTWPEQEDVKAGHNEFWLQESQPLNQARLSWKRFKARFEHVYREFHEGIERQKEKDPDEKGLVDSQLSSNLDFFLMKLFFDARETINDINKTRWATRDNRAVAYRILNKYKMNGRLLKGSMSPASHIEETVNFILNKSDWTDVDQMKRCFRNLEDYCNRLQSQKFLRNIDSTVLDCVGLHKLSVSLEGQVLAKNWDDEFIEKMNTELRGMLNDLTEAKKIRRQKNKMNTKNEVQVEDIKIRLEAIKSDLKKDKEEIDRLFRDNYPFMQDFMASLTEYEDRRYFHPRLSQGTSQESRDCYKHCPACKIIWNFEKIAPKKSKAEYHHHIKCPRRIRELEEAEVFLSSDEYSTSASPGLTDSHTSEDGQLSTSARDRGRQKGKQLRGQSSKTGKKTQTKNKKSKMPKKEFAEEHVDMGPGNIVSNEVGAKKPTNKGEKGLGESTSSNEELSAISVEQVNEETAEVTSQRRKKRKGKGKGKTTPPSSDSQLSGKGKKTPPSSDSQLSDTRDYMETQLTEGMRIVLPRHITDLPPRLQRLDDYSRDRDTVRCTVVATQGDIVNLRSRDNVHFTAPLHDVLKYYEDDQPEDNDDDTSSSSDDDSSPPPSRKPSGGGWWCTVL